MIAMESHQKQDHHLCPTAIGDSNLNDSWCDITRDQGSESLLMSWFEISELSTRMSAMPGISPASNQNKESLLLSAMDISVEALQIQLNPPRPFTARPNLPPEPSQECGEHRGRGAGQGSLQVSRVHFSMSLTSMRNNGE